MQSNAISVKSYCVKGSAGYSIQAGDITTYLWEFQVHFSCFFHQCFSFWAVMMSSGDLIPESCAQ